MRHWFCIYLSKDADEVNMFVFYLFSLSLLFSSTLL